MRLGLFSGAMSARTDLARTGSTPVRRERQPGDRIERYELLHPLGQGGMGSVWAARLHGTRGFEKIVAIKTVLPGLAADARVRAMFLDEARLASAVQHRNVAHILDFLESDGALYLVMEWIEGASLKSLHDASVAKREAIPRGVLLRALVDVCAGLHAAHELRDSSGALCELVHRDVSPQNVLVGVEGAAKLIDFGVAKARHRAAQETTFGALKGKVHFMAPEQALGEDVDRRADVWSVGAVLYYMLVGHGPFDTGGQLETLRLLVSGHPVRALPPDVHPAIVRVVSGCLARHTRDRFPTAEQLGLAIESAIDEMGVAASAQDVAAFVAERADVELAETREGIGQGVGEPLAATIAWAESTDEVRHRSARHRRSVAWLASATLGLASLVGLVVTRSQGPAAATVAAAPTPTPRPDVPDAPSLARSAPIIEITPAPALARAVPAKAHVGSAERRVKRRSVPSPAVPKRSDDFGSAVATRK